MSNFLVYKITRSDGELYVGSTKEERLRTRMSEHKGSKRFKGFDIVYEVLSSGLPYYDCLIVEKEMIEKYDTYKNGLNSTPDGTGNHKAEEFTTLGYKFSEKSRQKMRDAHKGRDPSSYKTSHLWTDEVRRKISLAQKGKPKKPKKLSKEQVQEIKSLFNSKPHLQEVGKIMKNGRKMSYIQAFSKEFCQKYDVSTQMIKSIVTGKTWIHV